MWNVYILKSSARERFYIGSTEDLAHRLKQHNGGKVRSTKGYRPWSVIYVEQFDTKEAAYAREKQIKSYKSGEAFRRLIS